MLEAAAFGDLRQIRKVPETHLVTLLALKALMGSRPHLCVYNPQRPDDSLYVRLEAMRHRAIATLQDHIAALRAYGLIDTYTADDGLRYLRLTLPEAPVPSGKKRAPFIRIDLGLMRYCRFLCHCVMPKSKQGWETVFISWVALKRCENRPSGLCCPSYQTLATSRGRHRITLIRHIRVLIVAGIIERNWRPWPSRRGMTRYQSNHYILLAPSALLQVERGELVTTNRGNLIPKPDPLNQKENKEINQPASKGGENAEGCLHTPENALPHPMWKCQTCGEIFEATMV